MSCPSKPNILFLGASYWCQYLATLLNERDEVVAHVSKNFFSWLLSKNKCVCLVGLGPPDTWKRQLYYQFAQFMYAIRLVKVKAIYWIGSDVMKLSANDLQIPGFYNFAGSPWLTEEVKAQGYDCTTCMFPVKIDIEQDCPWPVSEKMTVLCYIPDQSHALHGSEEVLLLSRQFPEVYFDVVGGLGSWCQEKPANMFFHGWQQDIKPFIRGAHVLLRRTKHDSFSAFVREGLATGRYVIFTYPVPLATYVASGDFSGLCQELQQLVVDFKQSRLHKRELNRSCMTEWLNYKDHLKQIADVFVINRKGSC